jgi:hypothetical protein
VVIVAEHKGLHLHQIQLSSERYSVRPNVTKWSKYDQGTCHETRLNSYISIVAVHGLKHPPTNRSIQSHGAFTTWRSDQRSWLKRWLPKRIPTARIFIYGYPSIRVFEDNDMDFRSHGDDLLTLLSSERNVSVGRPVVFICHSLGGIVVKHVGVL